MSPLVAAPNRGYADWQRVENWDSGLLVNLAANNTTANQTSSIVDVSRYQYLGGALTCTLFAAQIQVLWYADAAGTIQAGNRVFFLDAGIVSPLQMRLPNLGPFAQVFMTTYVAGNNYTASVLAFGTNRAHPLEFIPIHPVIIAGASAGLAAGVSANVYPSNYHSGPMRMNLQAFTAAMNFSIQGLWFGGAFQAWDSITVNPGTAEYTTVAPGTSWKVVVQNVGAAAGNYILSAVPSYTGSS